MLFARRQRMKRAHKVQRVKRGRAVGKPPGGSGLGDGLGSGVYISAIHVPEQLHYLQAEAWLR